MPSCDFYSSWTVIGFYTRWLVHHLLWFLFTMSDSYWFRHTMISAWPLVSSIHHEWLLLVSTHDDFCMTSSEFYSPWVIVIGFDTRWLVHDLFRLLFTMSDCYWFLHTVFGSLVWKFEREKIAYHILLWIATRIVSAVILYFILSKVVPHT